MTIFAELTMLTCSYKNRMKIAAAQSFTPLFTWNITSATSVYDVNAVPSLATLTTYIGRMTSEVQEALLRHQTQLFKLQNIAALTPEEKQDILEASDEDYLDDLAAIQRDQLTVQVLQKMLLTSTQEVMSALCKCILRGKGGACARYFISSGWLLSTP